MYGITGANGILTNMSAWAAVLDCTYFRSFRRIAIDESLALPIFRYRNHDIRRDSELILQPASTC